MGKSRIIVTKFNLSCTDHVIGCIMQVRRYPYNYYRGGREGGEGWGRVG